MASSRDRRNFSNRRMKIKNKWEVVLVLVVIAAGIVITTVAAIKAKEKRQLALHNDEEKSTVKVSTNSPTVAEVREVTSPSSISIAKFPTLPSNRKVKYDQIIITPDYDVEYDDVKPVNEEYTALASAETFEHPSKNRKSLKHDGLPGFPPPKGALASSEYNSKAELAAEGAGFVIESHGENVASIPSIVPPQKISMESFPKPAAVKIDSQSNHDLKNDPKKKGNFINSPKISEASPVVQPLSPVVQPPSPLPKFDLKRIPVFADPLMELVASHDMSEGIRRDTIAAKPENNKRIHLRVPFKSPEKSISQQQQNSPPPNLKKNTVPSIETAIRFLGLTDDIAYPRGISQLSQMPIALRSLFVQSSNRKKRSVMQSSDNHNIPTLGSDKNKLSSYLKEGLPFLLINHIVRNLNNHTQQKLKTKPINTDSTQHTHDLQTSASRFFSYDEDSPFRNRDDHDNDHDEDNDDDNTHEHDDDQSPGSLSPLFNFDDISNRFPSVSSAGRTHKAAKPQNFYSANESKKHQKYGILGSGNFEIIRGGIYSDDESATNNIPNYVRKNHERKSQNHSPHYDHQRGQHEDESNDDDNASNNQFGSFNDNFFAGNPVLGFQGYDNFGAATLGKHNEPKRSQRRYDSGPPPGHHNAHIHNENYSNGHYHRTIIPHHNAAASNLIPISSDHDLDTAS